ncbi:acetyltransferase [Paenibacillus mucilaginosus]|uniref:GCN5-related N-acetyltransferase n=1 Tax=Paenibacillus mucilaginosus (strain KNP414) TaxID=1036673 RepID=F8F5B6_PAEMK|nr:acetyltransferase [Paenibacillus mucilaginosus]AEI40927.1 GCN5-related N-acetyltransferase [Paenibacillus mucilaginosus KNP414]MCG7211617.1 acetyltransferase [Paenibacillus mucilaginosus]WDM30023.1 acetyltransferase [Paenibacillus mucilaginosus]
MTIDIIAYQEKFHDQLVDIWYRAVRQTHTFLTEEDMEFYHGIVRGGALREAEIWIALRDHREPVGFIGLDGSKIEMLFIDPSYHGQGIGSGLIRHVESMHGGSLQVDVNEQNDGACAFYKRYGFVQSGRSELDGAGRPFPLLHMELRRI